MTTADMTNGRSRAPRGLDKELVRHAIGERAVELLVSIGIPRDVLDGDHHPCPKCGGKDRFRLIDQSAGAILCSHCFNRKNGDVFAAISWWSGCRFQDAVATAANFAGLSKPVESKASQPKATTSQTDIPPDVTFEDVCNSKGMPIESAKAYGGTPMKWGRRHVVDFPMYGPDGRKCSRFAIPIEGGKGRNAAGVPAGLFLPHRDGQVILPAPGEEWIVVEGVKDAAALHGLGFNAVGLPTSSMNPKFARLFLGVLVTAVPDRDTAGLEGSRKTTFVLAETAASIKVATLPGDVKNSDGDDVRDVLAREGGESIVREAILNAAEACFNRNKRKPGTKIAVTDDVDGEAFDPLPTTDLGNSERFVEQHGQHLRFVATWDKWLVWDGKRWRVDSTRKVWQLAKKTVRSIYAEVEKLAAQPETTPDMLKELSSWAFTSEKRERINAMVALAANDEGVAIDHTTLDKHPWLLNCTNGTVDLHTGELQSHKPADMLTKISEVTYAMGSGTATPVWNEYLESTFRGDHDLIGFLQRLVGYAAVGVTQEHVLAILWGSGSNGKTTFVNAIIDALGDYAFQAPHGFLMVKRGEAHPTELTDLFGARFVSIAESQEGQRLDEGLVKMLTGGDRIRARRMREDFWEFAPTHTPFLATNHKPVVRGGDYAMWRRLKLIPFTATFVDPTEAAEHPGAPLKDPELPAKLRAERGGILHWIVAGCLAWQHEGLNPPETVLVATRAYKDESDTFKNWVAERCEVDPQAEWKASLAFKAYRDWCEETGERPMSRNRFALKVEEAGFTRLPHRRDGNYYRGFRSPN